MSKQQMVERTQRALAEFHRLPASEQARQLIERGIINDRGEVLMGGESAQAAEIQADVETACRSD